MAAKRKPSSKHKQKASKKSAERTEVRARASAGATRKKPVRKPALPKPSKHFERFTEDFTAVADAYAALGDAVHGAGPLDDHTRALVKLAISIGAGREGAAHSHTRKALAMGATPAELRHVAVLAMPTLGLPAMMAGLMWVDDVLEGRGGKRKK
jgi:alkylhydroperoxidase/carboxymuconolactone decarboxylase family protein YurZ